jgi:mRNA interferase MazF
MYEKPERSPESWRSCVVRGDVHQIKLPGKRGHVQGGRRYAVVVQADDLLALSTVVVCPTSRSAFAASFHPEVIIEGEPTQVLCEMVGAVDARMLGKRAGHLTHDELRNVEDALLLVLDLP